MKIVFSILVFCITHLNANELIHISNSIDLQSLKELEMRYKKDIVISDERAYIVPSECLLERYFGGLSQGSVELLNPELYHSSHPLTQKIFDAKDVKELEEEIQKQKISDYVEAKVAKEFLENVDGRFFGGLSQGNVDLQEQKRVVENVSNDSAKYTHPTCKLIDDGSGYEIYGSKNIKLYSSSKITDIKERVLFK